MKIAIGCDHSAIELKKEIIKYLEELGHNVTDFGTHTTESVDYPIYGKKVADAIVSKEYECGKVADAVVSKECECGVLICGTGIGISLAANKVKGIRAAVCSEPYSAKLSKQHNNSNIIAFGARVVGVDLAKMIVKEWLDAEYEGGRHARRVGLITKIENGEEI